MKIASAGGAALFSLSGLQGCGMVPARNVRSTPSSSENLAPQETVTSLDGTIALTLPKGWQRDQNLHDHAELQISYEAEQLYIIVLRDLKASGGDRSDLSIDDHAILTLNALSSRLVEPTISPPTAIRRIGSYQARQVDVQGYLDSVAVTYLHTTIETRYAFYQILAWTDPEQFDSHREQLQRVINSFQERSQPLPDESLLDEPEPNGAASDGEDNDAAPNPAEPNESPGSEDNDAASEEQAPSDREPEDPEPLPEGEGDRPNDDPESDRSEPDITNEPNPDGPDADQQNP
ncbi:hypothetical protein [Leptolyngbya sp. CCY15150]|uniref:hypothetical protein n=1 Tax=Leptolyngbya sp. CCY15150 TaxID=2767772 RepID=UPI00194E6CA9|nr:hypothetical protein [Leptolyngbya sp. CCY15150]